MAKKDNYVRCSFCGKSEPEVKKIIAGTNGVCICDECISVCNDIIEEEIYEGDDEKSKDEDEYTINLKKNLKN